VVNRILQERLSPVGSFLTLAGVGDAAAAPHVGRLKAAYFPYPVQRDPKTGAVIIPPEIDAAAAAAAMRPAAAPSGSTLKGGFLSRAA
jgi:hypothetical protein